MALFNFFQQHSDDPESFQPHRTTKQQRKELAIRMKEPSDELKLVIVRDMWLITTQEDSENLTVTMQYLLH